MTPASPPSAAPRAVSESTLSALPESLHPVLRRVYAARGTSPDELRSGLSGMLPVSTLEGTDAAAERLADAIERGENVLILGDFDADGATGTALLVTCLRAFGCRALSYLVPDRFQLGYGLSPEIADVAAERRPDLIVTVDNGISSIDGARRAREHGIDVLITDHHLPGDAMPEACAIVNPNVPGSRFASKALAGVGVAFYVMAALGRLLAERGRISAEDGRRIVAGTLDLVALGTVADLVPLDRNNRALVGEGLRRIRAGHARPGIQALFEAAGRNPQYACSSDLGFGVAPRLNAAGRLTDMSVGIECLLSDALPAARRQAAQLDELNRARRDLQLRMEADAQRHLDTLASMALESSSDAICLYADDWHEGIVGLVAGRIKEQTGRPVVAFARSGTVGELKGSARSIRGVHVRDVLDAVATAHPGLVRKFGGHAMAAGLTISEDAREKFESAFVTEVGRYREALDRADNVMTDGGLEPDDLQLELADAIRHGGPWGQGYPEPLFDNRFEVIEQRVLNDRHLKLRVRHPDGAQVADAIAFNHSEQVPEGGPARFLFRLDVNEYRNRRTPQLVVERIYYP